MVVLGLVVGMISLGDAIDAVGVKRHITDTGHAPSLNIIPTQGCLKPTGCPKPISIGFMIGPSAFGVTLSNYPGMDLTPP